MGRVETHLRACLNKAGAKIPVDRSAGAVVPIWSVDLSSQIEVIFDTFMLRHAKASLWFGLLSM